MTRIRHILRAIGFSALVLISWAFFAMVGAIAITWFTLQDIVPRIEERTIRKVNQELTDNRIKRFSFRTGDDGAVHIIINRR